ncbi:hypothetical protein CPC08DRAFT_715825 [Agrocybe pediades]|nr:hypothetical protein CPC08DRAFT_715825 [Agrocybe pediades]
MTRKIWFWAVSTSIDTQDNVKRSESFWRTREARKEIGREYEITGNAGRLRQPKKENKRTRTQIDNTDLNQPAHYPLSTPSQDALSEWLHHSENRMKQGNGENIHIGLHEKTLATVLINSSLPYLPCTQIQRKKFFKHI